jgi:hypothetical protein
MASNRIRGFERRLYRTALWLCPPLFRHDYSAEMLRDFEDAHREACAGGRRRDLWRVRVQISLDLVRTIAVQWARTGVPLIWLLSPVVPLVAIAGLTSLAARGRLAIPPDLDRPELQGLLLVTIASLFVIATTITLTVWASRPIRRLRR